MYLKLPLLGILWLVLSVSTATYAGRLIVVDISYAAKMIWLERAAIQALLAFPFAAWSAERDPKCPVRCALLFSMPSAIVLYLAITSTAQSPHNPYTDRWLSLATMGAPLIFPPAIFVMFAWARRIYDRPLSWFVGAVWVILSFSSATGLAIVYGILMSTQG